MSRKSILCSVTELETSVTRGWRQLAANENDLINPFRASPIFGQVQKFFFLENL